MFVMPGPPWSRKIGARRMRRARADAGHGQRDQPRLRVGPVLGDDERAAVGGVAALLGARSCTASASGRRPSPRRGRRPRRRRSEAEVAEAEHHEPDEHEADDAPRSRDGASARRRRSGAGSAPARARARARTCSSRGSHSSHRGRYQFQSPSSFIVAGRSTARTIVASSRIAAASPTPNCLKNSIESVAEDREHADHHDRGAGDDAGGRLDPVRDRLVHARAAVERLADPADDEDVVVHREPEQDHEQEQRHDRVDAGRGR